MLAQRVPVKTVDMPSTIPGYTSSQIVKVVITVVGVISIQNS